MSEPMGMFDGMNPRTVSDAERWLYAHGYHYQGDFTVQFPRGGGLVDLRQVVADFAELYHSALLGRVHAWQKVAEDAVNVRPVQPFIVGKDGL